MRQRLLKNQVRKGLKGLALAGVQAKCLHYFDNGKCVHCKLKDLS